MFGRIDNAKTCIGCGHNCIWLMAVGFGTWKVIQVKRSTTMTTREIWLLAQGEDYEGYRVLKAFGEYNLALVELRRRALGMRYDLVDAQHYRLGCEYLCVFKVMMEESNDSK